MIKIESLVSNIDKFRDTYIMDSVGGLSTGSAL